MSPITKFGHQHPKIVTNIKSPTSTCHQHLCSPSTTGAKIKKKPFSERIQTHIVPWIVVSVLVYTIFYLGALISSFLVIRDRFKVEQEVIENIRRRDAKNRWKKIQSVNQSVSRLTSVRSRAKSSDRSRNHTSAGEDIPLNER